MLVRTLSGNQHRPVSRLLSWEQQSWRHRRHSSKRHGTITEENEDECHVTTPYKSSKLIKKINIRVSGNLFQTTEHTLSAFPRTLLGRRSERDRFYNRQKDEYIFDRCCLSFDAILFYYQSKGILSRPAYVKRSKFIEELTFFKIIDFVDIRHRNETKFAKDEKQSYRKPSSKTKEYVWQLICHKNNPRYRNSSYMFYILMVIFSVVIICCEPTVPPKKIWFLFELFLSGIFTFEYGLRIFIANEIKRYLISPLGLLDLFSMLTSLLYITLSLTKHSMSTLSIIKFMQVIRILKYARVSRGVQEFFHVLWSCREQVTLFVGAALVSCFIAATMIHLAEQAAIDKNSRLEEQTDFFNWFWYSIITATGVGYGDYTPKSSWGKVCGGFLAVIGVLIFCLPATQLVYKFVDLYYLPDVLGNNSEGKRKLLITAVREKFLEDMESCATGNY